ncbi:MAG: 5-formyltetrahydrofolate cyclo-ligase [Gammaproteobacteria bacterium]|nr:5-formyltetrahydrofolate cyclo-ligase [Gammaproteobacteria bacterium]|tara:strand:+ start:674 stop:1294 length:621 start_codon:yes stop_codon:yes gene_type:complete
MKPSSPVPPPPLNTLRQQLRRARRQLSASQQRHAAFGLARHLRHALLWQGARRIAFYHAVDGEIDPGPALRLAWQLGKACYLPVLHPIKENQMVFVRVWPGSRLVYNRWGIAEPKPALKHSISPGTLDLVLMPLVGFDEAGHRIGMGKGFYDRTFAFRRSQHRRPALVGLAHECQKVAGGITPSAWDVALDALATPRRYKALASHR